MDGGFDVYDEWGRYKGRFTPAWSTEGCLGMVFGLLIMAIGFFLYLLIKLIIDGFKLAVSGNWGKALLYWSLPAFMVLLLVAFIGVSFVNVFAANSRIIKDIQPAPYTSPVPIDTLEAIPSTKPEFGDTTNPKGEPLSDWNGIPIIPSAISGEEVSGIYSFKAHVTIEEMFDYYKTELGALGWTESFSMPNTGTGAQLVYEKDNHLVTITISDDDDGVLVFLTYQ